MRFGPPEYAKVDGDEVPLVQALAIDPRFRNVTMLTQTGGRIRDSGQGRTSCGRRRTTTTTPTRSLGPATDRGDARRGGFAALKPGGVFIVIDHVAEAGSGIRDTNTLHRIDPEIVKAQAAAAGFTLDSESAVLRNPGDTHAMKVFDPSVRGRTVSSCFQFPAAGLTITES